MKSRRLRVVGVVWPVGVFLLWWLTSGDDVGYNLWRRYETPVALFNIVVTVFSLAASYVVLSPPREIAQRTLRVTVAGLAAGLTLGLLELPVLFGYDYALVLRMSQADTWLQLASGVNRADPELIHVHHPHTRYTGTVTGNLVASGIPSPIPYAVDVAYDRYGFRNDEDLTQADVVAIGDSFVEGAETAQTQTVVAELGRQLGVTVANLGQSNYGPQQELVVLRRYGVPLAPRVVVWFFFGGNDLRDVDTYERQRRDLAGNSTRRPLRKRWFARNALKVLSEWTTPRRQQPSDNVRRRRVTYTNADGQTETLYLDANEGPWGPHQWEVATKTLRAAQDVTQRIGAQLLVVYIPRKFRVYKGFVHSEPDSVTRSWQLNNLPDVLAEWSVDHGIEFLDATVPLRAAVAQGESVYLPDDVHWNAAGHRVVGAAVSRRIERISGLAPAGAGASR